MLKTDEILNDLKNEYPQDKIDEKFHVYYLKLKENYKDLNTINWMMREDYNFFLKNKDLEMSDWNFIVRDAFLTDDERKNLFFNKMLKIGDLDYILSRVRYCITEKNIQKIEELFDDKFHQKELSDCLKSNLITLSRVHKVIDHCLIDSKNYHEIGLIIQNPNIDLFVLERLIMYQGRYPNIKSYRISLPAIVNHPLATFNLIWQALNTFSDLKLTNSDLKRIVRLSQNMNDQERFLLASKLPKLLKKGLSYNLTSVSIDILEH